MSPPRNSFQYEETASGAVRFDAIAGQLAQISGQLTVVLEMLRGLRDDPEPAKEEKPKHALSALLDPRVAAALVLFTVALAIISASTAIVALVLSGNGSAVAELVKGLKG